MHIDQDAQQPANEVSHHILIIFRIGSVNRGIRCLPRRNLREAITKIHHDRPKR